MNVSLYGFFRGALACAGGQGMVVHELFEGEKDILLYGGHRCLRYVACDILRCEKGGIETSILPRIELIFWCIIHIKYDIYTH
jgi:hypothetical protein